MNTILVWLANVVLLLHVSFVAFVVVGLALVYVGYFFDWHWVRSRVFRLVHLAAIGYVVVQSWLGVICPLTVLEMKLRASAGLDTYNGSFIQHWLQSLLYYSAPDWVFILVYSLFGALVAFSWWLVRPR
ncbi:DUF2784 domain-containing protein [Saccharospirillum mangrovi]|uniref:DUF2784 domain-containing protein n=1 Tax=Saccharospirillum mangrovi TaxID=2161747 RepID=UPI000D33EEE8|nr:DUF2784 domain-containing protein [Saccharospirillum mangrovi]